jgi:transcriptional regulator with XRE-family HTH domain
MSGLKRVLDRLGLKQTDFARLLDVSPRTVSLWATGEVTIPGPVRAYLRMLQFADESRRTLEFARLAAQSPCVHDGLYSLRYRPQGHPLASGVEGDGIALLKAGRIVGSDTGGGKFEGSYRFDSTRQTFHFRVWLRVPPQGQLMTGLETKHAGSLLEVVAEFDRPDPFSSTVAHVEGRPLAVTMAYLGPLSG